MDDDMKHFNVTFMSPIVETDNESINEEIAELSDANDNVQSEAMKRTVQEHVVVFNEATSLVDSAPPEEEWIMKGDPTKAIKLETVSDQTASPKNVKVNKYYLLDDGDDDENQNDHDEHFGSIGMEQSMESHVSESPKKLKKSDRQKFLTARIGITVSSVGLKSTASLRRAMLTR